MQAGIVNASEKHIQKGIEFMRGKESVGQPLCSDANIPKLKKKVIHLGPVHSLHDIT